MPNRVHLLSEITANQIAAGEVIERPASVVKELVENSIDAQATQIDLVIKGGGRSLIQVTDNGFGMSRDDALLCLERHATSKIKTGEDLKSLLSYGFRGEAIPSIASVSHFRLKTSEPGSVSGTEIQVDGGKIISVQDVGMASGTQLEIRSLFYNLPARRKFLKTENTELSHVQQQVIYSALARPDVGWKLHYEAQNPKIWAPGQDLSRRCAAIFGEAWIKEMIPVDHRVGGYRLWGLIGRPGMSRSNRAEEFFFVNQRPVESKALHYGLLEGYHNSLMRGRYPLCVLFFEIDPAEVDVNIHPAKREVRFHQDFGVRQFVVETIKKSIRGHQVGPTPIYTPSHSSSSSMDTPVSSPNLIASSPMKEGSRPEIARPMSLNLDEPIVPHQGSVQQADSVPFKNLSIRITGAVGNLYLTGECPEGLILIDQHAAHERVWFEKLLKQVKAQEVVSQKLLLPVTLQVTPQEGDFIQRQLNDLNQVGLGISLFGTNSFLVDAIPSLFRTKNVEGFLRYLLNDLQEEGGETRKKRLLGEETIAKKACRQAVKASDPLKPQEWNQLVIDLLQCEFPYTCPHGRPTLILMKWNELDRKFGRIV